MRRRIKIFSAVVLVTVCLYSKASEQPVKPAVFVLNAEMLEKNRSRINGKDPLLLPAYKQLIKDADKAIKFGPVSVMEKKNDPPSGNKHDYMSLAPYHWPDPVKTDGLPYIRKDGQTNPEVREYKDKEYLPKLCESVYVLGLASYFSGEKMYAEHAAKLLRVWFLDTATRMNPNLNFGQAIKGVNTGRGAGLIDSRHFIKLVDGIGLIQESKAWKKEDHEGMKKWFSDFLQWMQTSKIGTDEMRAQNNHGAWYDAQRLSMALFTGNTDLAKKIVMNAMGRLDTQMDEKGSFPKEMERTTSLHYTVFVMEAFLIIAQMADNAGINFRNNTTASGKSLKKGFEALAPYLMEGKKWQGQQIKEYDVEEGYVLLVQAADHFSCKKCKDAIKTMAGDKAERLRINLLY